MAEKIRTAVIGVGYLGNFHAEKYALLENSELVAVVDPDLKRAEEIASRLGTAAYADYSAVIGKVDAVSIVVPTRLHFQVAREFLNAGVHVLLEKPVTVTLEEADELVAIAAEKKLVLQVGHLERFNPAFIAATGLVANPRFIEARRIAPFKPRGTDVNVVLDLMIHDLDLIHSIVDSPVRAIEAVGAPVLTAGEDIANARLTFENGCVANVTVSRVSAGTERKMQIIQPDSYIVVDFQNRTLSVSRKGTGETFPGIPEIVTEERTFEQSDALRSEIESFLTAISTGTAPVVGGADGRNALETALLVNRQMQAHRAE